MKLGIRVLIAFLFVGALASFGYGFWMVLSPDKHSWHVSIPLDRPGSNQEADKRRAALKEGATSAVEADAGGQPAAEVKAAAAAAQPTVPDGHAASPPPISLSLPIACDPGADCWVINYVDVDPGPGRLDFRCNQMSYDGHKGTDIGLANMARIADTVPILAALDGKVVGTRDGEPDGGAAGIAAAKKAGKECGNGVRIDHGNGWATQYCHMRKDSVLVRQGQEVQAGQILGAVGLSGVTEFPHVHISVTHDGKVVDPFRGVAGGPECAVGKAPLWDEQTLSMLMAVAPPVVVDAGFLDSVPTMDQAATGDAAVRLLGRDAPAIVFWFRSAGVKDGDTAHLTIANPSGETVFDQLITFDRDQAMVFRAAGLKNNPAKYPDGLSAGAWRGRVEMRRDDKTTADRTVLVDVAG